ncbi:MFS transporter [Spongisporangium articulatum]|uniref:MFS transporter n=1 Tax=Spongisporangium articulatum TaxID=3362603 RepID=A0ABW8AK43_9ACTN
MIAFEAMSISTAMPVVARDLGAIREYGFVFSAFLTPFLLGGVLAGSWGDAAGPRPALTAGLALFGGGLLVCGLAESLEVLLVGRAVAGAGAGLLAVSMYVAIAAIIPGELQPRLFSLISAGWVLPGILGPALAGFLAEHVSWRAVFLLVPPLTVPPALALLPRVRHLGNDDPGRTSPLARVVAGAALAVGVGGLQWGLGSLDTVGGALPVVATVAGAVLTGLAFPRLTPPGTARLGRGLPTVIALRGLYCMAFFGVESFVPLMLVTQRGLSPTLAGITLSLGAIGWTVGSYIQGRPNLAVPRHVLLSAAGIVVGLSTWAMTATIRPEVPVWLASVAWAVAALGMGLGMASVSVLTLRLSLPHEKGVNSAALQLSDALGSALGIGLAGAAFATWHDPVAGDAALFTGIWLAGGAVAVFAGLVAPRARTA